jgi:phospholipid/cholesterol/gamma-HCH transport system substrate-binding protein
MEIRGRNVTALGLLVLAAAVLFTWGMFFLQGRPVLGGGLQVLVVLEDGAGLKRGDRVQLQGVEVGAVRSVRLEAPGRVLAELVVDGDLKLPADTRAWVVGDVFGAHMVELVPGTAMVKLEAGDTIRGEAAPAFPAMMAELGGKARTVLARADSLLSPAAIRDMHATAAVLPASAQELRAAFVELRRAAESLRRSTEAAESAGAGPALASALWEIEASAKSFSAAADAMERSLGSLASVLAKVDAGEGTLGRLVNDSTLYGELHGAIREMRELAADIRERPERYVRIKIF